MTKKYIAYVRVSTQKQGRSGLGLEAQRLMISIYAKQHGDVLAEYVEVDSGDNNDRAQLAAARKHAKKAKAYVLVAKVDRLSRNLAFIANLMETDTRFETCETGPEANNMMIYMRAMMAQWEREMISARTKAACDAKRARGGVLGHPDFKDIRHLGPARYSEKRRLANNGRAKLVGELRAKGLTLEQIAAELMERGIKTARDNDEWTATQVRRLLK